MVGMHSSISTCLLLCWHGVHDYICRPCAWCRGWRPLRISFMHLFEVQYLIATAACGSEVGFKRQAMTCNTTDIQKMEIPRTETKTSLGLVSSRYIVIRRLSFEDACNCKGVQPVPAHGMTRRTFMRSSADHIGNLVNSRRSSTTL